LSFECTFYLSACPATLPEYNNGVLSSGGGQNQYLPGHMLTYMCNANFGSTSNPLMCVCDGITDPNNPQWVCAPADLVNTCRRGKNSGFYLSARNTNPMKVNITRQQ